MTTLDQQSVVQHPMRKSAHVGHLQGQCSCIHLRNTNKLFSQAEWRSAASQQFQDLPQAQSMQQSIANSADMAGDSRTQAGNAMQASDGATKAVPVVIPEATSIDQVATPSGILPDG